MDAVSAILPIDAAVPAFITGREAGILIKPLIARIGKQYGAGGDSDRQVHDGPCLAFESLYFFGFC